MIRMILALVFGVGSFGLVAWQMEMGPFGTGPSPTKPDGHHHVSAPVNLGGPLFSPTPFPAENGTVKAPLLDPITVAATLQAVEKADISPKNDGQILLIGDLVPEGVVQAAGVACFLAEPFYPVEIPIIGDKSTVRFYRRFYEGSVVNKDQMIGLIDPAKALSDIAQKRAKVEVSQAERDAAHHLFIEYSNRFDREDDLKKNKAGTLSEWGAALASKLKGKADLMSKEEMINFAKTEMKLSELNFRFHEVRNPLSVKHAIIQTIYKNIGESVKGQDPIVRIYSLDRLRADGFLEIQHGDRIKEGSLVTIEPTQESGPIKAFPGHRKGVTAVAVLNLGVPLAVSGSEDGTVKIWSESSIGPVHEYTHAQPVRALAASPATLKQNSILVGDDGGNIQLWDVKTQKMDRKAQKPRYTKKAYDGTPVTAVAFTPDGKFFATGSAGGVIKLWETETGLETWTIDAEHGADDRNPPHTDMITSMHFTPQCRLVTASRDNTLRVWSVHENGVELAYDRIPDRGGAVANLGVSQDGRWMLFDQGKGKILQLLSVEDGRMVNYLKSPQGGNPFESVAVFSPDGTMLLTGGAADGRLQLWQTPSASARGFEVRQFTPDERGRVTSAAFAPAGAGGQSPFAVSGDSKGYVYLWPVPSKKEVESHRITDLRVTQISKNLDADTRQFRIGIEVPNASGRLLPGRPVTIVIE